MPRWMRSHWICPFFVVSWDSTPRVHTPGFWFLIMFVILMVSLMHTLKSHCIRTSMRFTHDILPSIYYIVAIDYFPHVYMAEIGITWLVWLVRVSWSLRDFLVLVSIHKWPCSFVVLDHSISLCPYVYLCDLETNICSWKSKCSSTLCHEFPIKQGGSHKQTRVSSC